MSEAWAAGSWRWSSDSSSWDLWRVVRDREERDWEADWRRRERALRRVEREEEMRERQERSEVVWKLFVVWRMSLGGVC